jgi:hypothetical protein
LIFLVNKNKQQKFIKNDKVFPPPILDGSATTGYKQKELVIRGGGIQLNFVVG